MIPCEALFSTTNLLKPKFLFLLQHDTYKCVDSSAYKLQLYLLALEFLISFPCHKGSTFLYDPLCACVCVHLALCRALSKRFTTWVSHCPNHSCRRIIFYRSDETPNTRATRVVQVVQMKAQLVEGLLEEVGLFLNTLPKAGFMDCKLPAERTLINLIFGPCCVGESIRCRLKK